MEILYVKNKPTLRIEQKGIQKIYLASDDRKFYTKELAEEYDSKLKMKYNYDKVFTDKKVRKYLYYMDLFDNPENATAYYIESLEENYILLDYLNNYVYIKDNIKYKQIYAQKGWYIYFSDEFKHIYLVEDLKEQLKDIIRDKETIINNLKLNIKELEELNIRIK